MARYSKEAVEAAIFSSRTTIGIANLKEKQKEVKTYFVEGNDWLAILPTGYRKSFCLHCYLWCVTVFEEAGNKLIGGLSALGAGGCEFRSHFLDKDHLYGSVHRT